MGIGQNKKEQVNCDYCNKIFYLEPSLINTYKNHFCSKSCAYKYKQKGCGITTDGYIWIRIDDREIKLHRYLMEIKLGRKLLSSEIVHHIDFNKFNNDINNLLLTNKSEHNRIHRNFCKENRKDCFTDKEIQMIKSNCSFDEFNKIFPNKRTEGCFRTTRYKLLKGSKRHC
jgi:trehalose/maltose hydrolase-like predicted phosphorylase